METTYETTNGYMDPDTVYVSYTYSHTQAQMLENYSAINKKGILPLGHHGWTLRALC